jgi:hypothetical protein
MLTTALIPMPKQTLQDSKFPQPIVRNANIYIDDNRLDFPNHRIVRKLGQGQNGVVFLTELFFLQKMKRCSVPKR